MFKQLDIKFIGGILLIVGTSMGGGMLALPIANAKAGFINASLLMILCWFIMTACAFLVLEINLRLPANTNLISMATLFLGRWGTIIAWVSYLLLFYSVLAAYMAGGGDFLSSLLASFGLTLPHGLTTLLFVGALSYVVYRGIHYVDCVNRGLMLSKLGIYFLLILLLMPFISVSKLQAGQPHYFTSGLSVIITSFTFANIIPSLRTYFQEDIPKLRCVILVGSLIPLICYLLWNLVIMGILPREGHDGLIALQQSGRSTSGFVAQLSQVLNSVYITLLAKIFTSICLATSFLASMLSLSDFLADGFRVKKKGSGGMLVYAATLIPPITIVLFSPGIFIEALGYAGIFCAILFILLPTLMAWRGRYHATSSSTVAFLVKGGKPLLLFLGFTGLFFTGYGIKMALL